MALHASTHTLGLVVAHDNLRHPWFRPLLHKGLMEGMGEILYLCGAVYAGQLLLGALGAARAHARAVRRSEPWLAGAGVVCAVLVGGGLPKLGTELASRPAAILVVSGTFDSATFSQGCHDTCHDMGVVSCHRVMTCHVYVMTALLLAGAVKSIINPPMSSRGRIFC